MSKMSNLAIIIDDLKSGNYQALEALNRIELEIIISILINEVDHDSNSLP